MSNKASKLQREFDKKIEYFHHEVVGTAFAEWMMNRERLQEEADDEEEYYKESLEIFKESKLCKSMWGHFIDKTTIEFMDKANTANVIFDESQGKFYDKKSGAA